MGKRSDFKRIERDFYPTPHEAVLPLVNYDKTVPSGRTFEEPCCGMGDLVKHLQKHDYVCVRATDIKNGDEFDATKQTSCLGDMFITNPPWDRKILHPLIERLSSIAPTWLLFDSDWPHTKQSIPFMKYCHVILSIGRVKWIPDSKMTGKDNCARYFFNQNAVYQGTRFIGR